jgi:hypothetical protein
LPDQVFAEAVMGCFFAQLGRLLVMADYDHRADAFAVFLGDPAAF